MSNSCAFTGNSTSSASTPQSLDKAVDKFFEKLSHSIAPLNDPSLASSSTAEKENIESLLTAKFEGCDMDSFLKAAGITRSKFAVDAFDNVSVGILIQYFV